MMKNTGSPSLSFLALFLLIAITGFIIFRIAQEGERLDESFQSGFDALQKLDELQQQLDEAE